MSNTNELSLSREKCDRYLITTNSLEKVNELRNAMMLRMEPQTWIYVTKSMVKKNGWDIFISDYLGKYPSNWHYQKALKFAKLFLKRKK